MIKTFSSRTCAFDAEWVPCADTARRLLELPNTTGDREAFEAIWRHYAREGDERPFLKLILSKVVTIAAVFRTVDRDGAPKLTLFGRRCDTAGEGPMIAEFLERVAEGSWQLWGFNSAAADVPIMKQRAVALGIPLPTFSKRPPKPWDGMDYHDARNSDAHMDILDILGGFSAAARPSLNELAVACSFPGKLDVSGADVAERYLAGRLDEILEYNETDAVTTHLAMLRLGFVTAHLSQRSYRRELDAVSQLVDVQVSAGKQQFAKFRTAWDAMRDA